MKGHDHENDKGITMSNVNTVIQQRFRYANDIRARLAEARAEKPMTIDATQRVTMISSIYENCLEGLARSETILRAIFKPRHYAALENSACQIIKLQASKKSSLPTGKSSKQAQAS